MYNTNQIYGNNPYYGGYIPQQPIQPQIQAQMYRGIGNLQGKSIDNLEVVKATDIPLDGSISYFPLADGSAIATKQLMQDGTSKIKIYKPVDEEAKQEQPKYITESDLKAQIKDFNSKDIKDIKEELKSLKRQVEDITDDLKEKKGK